MAKTIPSFSTSMDPEQTKKMAWRASPCRSRYSPGVQKEVLMCSDSERRQPRLAEANNDSSRISLLRCMVMSERSSSGKSFSSCTDDEEERKGKKKTRERGWECVKRDSCEKKTSLSCSVIEFSDLTVLFSMITVFMGLKHTETHQVELPCTFLKPDNSEYLLGFFLSGQKS